MVDVTTSSDDAEESKPGPGIFEVALKKLNIEGADAVAIGDTSYDAEASAKAEIATIGVLCGGFPEIIKKGWMRRDFSRTGRVVRPLWGYLAREDRDNSRTEVK